MLRENYPGLSFEEYRECSVFLSCYQYLSIIYQEKLPENSRLKKLAYTAQQGRLQIKNFCSFMKKADKIFTELGSEIHLLELCFWERLQQEETDEKQKSIARFLRKRIKTLYHIQEEGMVTADNYHELFASMIEEFAESEKYASIPETVNKLYEIFVSEDFPEQVSIFQPQIKYGILANNRVKCFNDAHVYGCETEKIYQEIVKIYAWMKHKTEQTHIFSVRDWFSTTEYDSRINQICAYFPEEIPNNDFIKFCERKASTQEGKGFSFSKQKSEFAFLMAMFSYLEEQGEMSVILPSALLYREGKDGTFRRYFTAEKNWMDTAVLLPKNIFDSVSQNPVFLHFKKNRAEEDILLIDCTRENLTEEMINKVEESYKNRTSIPDFSIVVQQDELKQNDYNLNFPRYLSNEPEKEQINLEEKKEQIIKIERELEEIEKKLELYRRDLSIR